MILKLVKQIVLILNLLISPSNNRTAPSQRIATEACIEHYCRYVGVSSVENPIASRVNLTADGDCHLRSSTLVDAAAGTPCPMLFFLRCAPALPKEYSERNGRAVSPQETIRIILLQQRFRRRSVPKIIQV